MALARTWQIRLNLDDVNAAVMLMETDAEMAAFARGLIRGINGGGLKEGASMAYFSGWEIGNDGRTAAEDARVRAKKTGKLGGRPKNQMVNLLVYPLDSQMVNQQVDQQANLNHKPLTINQEQETNNEQPKKQASVAREVVEYWNESIKGTALPSARNTDPRSKVIATRAKDPAWFDDFKQAIAYIKTDSFYQGAGSTSWIATIDYLLQAGKATELAEKATAKPIGQKPIKPQINGFTPEMYGGANAPDQW